MGDKPYPPMPTSQEEWETHCAFYRLTVMQRDAAWREVEALRPRMEALHDLYMSTLEARR